MGHGASSGHEAVSRNYMKVSPMTAAKNNNSINMQIATESKERRALMKILCLGTANSGKSTVLKQMRILHLDGFNDVDKTMYLDAMLFSFLNAVNDLLQKLPDSETDDVKSRIASISSGTINKMKTEKEFLFTVVEFLKSQRGKQVLKSVNKCTPGRQYVDYFLDRIHGLKDLSELTPTADDILRVRVPTTGVSFTNFKYKQATFCMIDVGGQRSERRKWIHLFDDVKAVLYIVDINNYEALAESLEVFANICVTPSLQQASIILFFNKIDLFMERDDRHELSRYFPSYKHCDDYQEASEFLKNQFLEKHPGNGTKVYSFFTCATDTRNIDRTFSACSDIVLKSSLAEAGLY